MTGTCVYKTEITSGSRKWGHLPTIGIPKAIYHYVTNTTKQQPTYQLFQNIMRPKNQLVNPPKMKKFNSICAFSRFLLQLWSLKLGQLANQSGSSRHMTCKMAGNGPSRQGSHACRRAWLTVTWCKMRNWSVLSARYPVNKKYIPCNSAKHTIFPFGAIWWYTFHLYKPW